MLFYDGSAHVEERAQAGNAILRRYIHGPGADTPLVWYEGSGTNDRRWLIPDERGSIIAITNSSGTATNINRYDEYGVPASTNVGRFQYTGQAWIPELQLYYYKARIYAPTLGRFMQTDPTGYDDGPNWYDYVGGDPVNKGDPTGTRERELQTGTRVRTMDQPNPANVQSNGGPIGGGTFGGKSTSQLGGVDSTVSKMDQSNTAVGIALEGAEKTNTLRLFSEGAGRALGASQILLAGGRYANGELSRADAVKSGLSAIFGMTKIGAVANFNHQIVTPTVVSSLEKMGSVARDLGNRFTNYISSTSAAQQTSRSLTHTFCPTCEK